MFYPSNNGQKLACSIDHWIVSGLMEGLQETSNNKLVKYLQVMNNEYSSSSIDEIYAKLPERIRVLLRFDLLDYVPKTELTLYGWLIITYSDSLNK